MESVEYCCCVSEKEIVLKMKNVLIKNGFDVSAVCVTGAQAIQAVERLEAGVVVCGIRFADMIYNELKECIPDTFEMVVIASNAQWQEYGDDDVIYLPLPLKAYDLVDTVSDLLTDIHRRLKRERKSRIRDLLLIRELLIRQSLY